MGHISFVQGHHNTETRITSLCWIGIAQLPQEIVLVAKQQLLRRAAHGESTEGYLDQHVFDV